MRIFKLARHMKYSKVLYFGISFLFFSIYANALFTSANTRPTADAGADRTFNVGEEIRLQGSGTDLDKDPLTFAWAIVFKPAGSKTILPNNNIPNPSFIPDLEGDYMFNLKFPPFSWMEKIGHETQTRMQLPWGLVTQVVTVGLLVIFAQGGLSSFGQTFAANF